MKLLIGIIIVLSLLLNNPLWLVGKAMAAGDNARWLSYNIPGEGDSSGWLLASGSDIRKLAIDNSGGLYACVTGLSNTLYKSTDGGNSWYALGNITEDIVDIAISDGEEPVIYCATASGVYKSLDKGESFIPLAASPGDAGNGNVEITAIDAIKTGDIQYIAAATKDRDSNQFGGVYILDDSQIFANWIDTFLKNYDVYDVAFSPNYVDDEQIVAVVTDEVDTFVTTRIGNAGWGVTIGNARLDKDNSGSSVKVTVSADIAFPDDYGADTAALNTRYVQYIAVDSGSGDGDVYIIYGRLSPEQSVATDLNAGTIIGWDNMDITSIQVKGEVSAARILAGAAESGCIYHSSDGGQSWQASRKDATGQSQTFVLMTDDFLFSSKAYAATSGNDSAISLTLDGGLTWNQTGLIDTTIDALLNLAVSSDYEKDGSLFLLSWGDSHSLWRTTDFGESWQRVFCSAMPAINSIDMVCLSPGYGDGNNVLYLTGEQDDSPGIWKSEDNGDNFSFNDAPLPVDYMLMAGDRELFLAGFDGASGFIYKTRNSGRSYTSTTLGSNPITSLALSPDYEEDGVLLAGNSNGWVYWSKDEGTSFETFPSGATVPPLSGNISVTFDNDYSDNQTVYAASDNPDQGVFRFVIGQSKRWQQLDGSLPAGGMLGDIATSDDGVLYATNFQQVDDLDIKGGIERTLNPSRYYGTTFETVTKGLDDGATLWGLWINGRRLWSLDTTGNKLMTFYDSLAQPVTLTSPLDGAPGVGVIKNDEIRDIELDWQGIQGATGYQWQLSEDSSFSSVPAGFEGVTTSSYVKLPYLEIGGTYYWRVRANSPLLSLWSEKWSFTTSLGGDIVAPLLQSPAAGESGVATRPVFQWSAVSGADGYELLVSLDHNFTNIVISKLGGEALSGNAWQYDIDLEYEVTYYWKVRAVSISSHSAWSAIGAFTIKPAPSIVTDSYNNPGEKPPAAIAPLVTAEPGWVIYVLIALASVVVLLMVIILVLVTRKN